MRRTIALLLVLATAWSLAADLTIDSTASQARYRVREQLVGISFPNDAVGVTTNVTGTITLAADGTVAAGSVITIDVSTLTSDQRRRDEFLQRSALQTAQYPTVTFEPTSVSGVSDPLPTSGSHEVLITGVLTVRGVATTVVWSGTATFSGSSVALEAATTFTFADIDMDKPRAASVLSVADDITLEVSLVLQAIE